jgi:(Z)-2-((N-methylformamido)methylene)-5-hydroxybutyrolactone dehydrogenase
MERFELYIGASRVPAAGGETFETVDPFTGEPWATVARGGPVDVDRAVTAAHAAFTTGTWPTLTASARGRMLHRLGDLVLEAVDDLVRIESRDNGKAHSELGVALTSMAGWYHYFGGLADKIEGRVIPVDKPDALDYTLHEPYGVVAAVLPWNSPLRLAAWKIAPALAAGNTVVVKPSEHTSTSILAFMTLVERAGFPPGVVNVVTGFGPDVVPALVEHPLVKKVSFTGGTAAGRVVAELAAHHFKPVTLELGGKSPQIVFDDADLDRAARGLAAGVFASGGQTCLAGSRAIVHSSVHDELVSRVIAVADATVLGNPSDASTTVGPVATSDQFERILARVAGAERDGAKLVAGGEPAQLGRASFVPPTIFTSVEADMELFREEVFGPVLAVTPFETEKEAVDLANAVDYGLAAGIWTRDLARAHRVARRVEAGTVWVNTYRNTVPQSPFGGYKASGLGREGGVEAVKEYLQTKNVWIDLS